MPIKILHTSDWHLGKSIYGHSLIEDQAYFIDNIFFPTLIKEKPNLVIISGDIFDKHIAPISAINLFNSIITKISKDLHIPICIISGNHDSPERMCLASDILRQNGIYIASNISDVYSPVELNFNGENVNIFLLPYFNLQMARSFLKNENISSLEEAYKYIIEALKVKLNKNNFNILVTHTFVTGCTCDKSQTSLQIGGSDEVCSNTFSDFDYVALGHLHSSQKSGNNGKYSGSPLQYSFDEPDKSKSFTLLNITNKNLTIKELEIKPLHKMQTISGMFSDIVELGKNSPSDDYICINLEDNMPIYMPMEQLRVYFKNILTLNTNWINGKKSSDILQKSDAINRLSNPEHVFKEFLQQICLTEATEDDIKIFNQAIIDLKKDEHK